MNRDTYLPYIFNNLKKYILIIYLVTLGSIAGILYSIVLKIVLDEVLLKNKYHILDELALILLLSFLITSLINYSNGTLVLELTQSISINIKSKVLNHIQKIPVEAFGKYDCGDLTNRTINDVDTISNFLSSSIIVFFANLGNAIMYLFLMIKINQRFAMITVIMCIVQLVISKRFNPKLKTTNRELKEKNSEQLDLLTHIFNNHKFYKAYNKSSYNNEKYRKIIFCIKKISFNNFKIKFLYNTTISATSFLSSLLILGLGIHEIICGRMTVGTLFLIDSISEMFVQSANALMGFNIELQNAYVSMERVKEIMDIEQEKQDKNFKENYRNLSISNICFDNVSFRYLEKKILNNIDLEFQRGQSYAIMGTSGRGKTTIAYLLLLFYNIQKGKILINQIDIKDIPVFSLREKIAIVMQESVILNGTIKENIMLDIVGEEESRFKDIIRICYLDEFVGSMKEGYETMLGEKGRQLSEGQKQRISIARGLIKKADVYIFDEITSHLDYQTSCNIIHGIQGYLQDKIIIYISHDMSIKKFADHVIDLQEHIEEVEGKSE